MWEALNSEVIARLPRQHLNGKANGTDSTKASPQVGTWEECLCDLERYRLYGEDWDGQGAAFGKPAKLIPGEIIDSAVALARALQRHGVLAPHATCPGVRGTVALEWDLTADRSVTLEVVEPTTVEMSFFSPGVGVEELVLTEPVLA